MCVRVFAGDFFADIREGIPGPALLVTSSDHRANYTAGHTHTHANTHAQFFRLLVSLYCLYYLLRNCTILSMSLCLTVSLKDYSDCIQFTQIMRTEVCMFEQFLFRINSLRLLSMPLRQQDFLGKFAMDFVDFFSVNMKNLPPIVNSFCDYITTSSHSHTIQAKRQSKTLPPAVLSVK